ncbi:hypothetical protein BJP40_02680 [Streptomyces sp. CC53]|uniref:hypothetical protein n=1 Tax=Streptomyces sp. CC53 TaxID=1906740 RepID=UPI0008DE80E4|nr:hypothetical protein [Streptomyces sp. CC53]OII63803.1 hypothetical protein BJP40_02680 [Streptomyces sp. CC53]
MTTSPEPTGLETLADLVSAVAGDRGAANKLTFEQLAERSVDPRTGYQPSPNLLWRLARQKGVKVNPELVSALAVGLSKPLERVQAAAAFEFTGYIATKVEGGTLVHALGADVSDTPKANEVLSRWAQEHEDDSSAD